MQHCSAALVQIHNSTQVTQKVRECVGSRTRRSCLPLPPPSQFSAPMMTSPRPGMTCPAASSCRAAVLAPVPCLPDPLAAALLSSAAGATAQQAGLALARTLVPLLSLQSCMRGRRSKPAIPDAGHRAGSGRDRLLLCGRQRPEEERPLVSVHLPDVVGRAPAQRAPAGGAATSCALVSTLVQGLRLQKGKRRRGGWGHVGQTAKPGAGRGGGAEGGHCAQAAAPPPHTQAGGRGWPYSAAAH